MASIKEWCAGVCLSVSVLTANCYGFSMDRVSVKANYLAQEGFNEVFQSSKLPHCHLLPFTFSW